MAQQTGVHVNNAGMDELLKSAGVRALLRAEAEAIASRARAAAPVVTGKYRDSIEVKETTASAFGIHFRAGSNDRPMVIVIATAPHSHIVEAKTGNLARALGGS
jgi:hypothetical protein